LQIHADFQKGLTKLILWCCHGVNHEHEGPDMQVLILGDDHGQQARLGAAMMKKGFQVICVESAVAASSYIRSELIDVLILTETSSGRISQSCACVRQSRNQAVSVIVISGRTGAALDELFEEVPQLYGVMGLDMAPAIVAALALASILPQQAGPVLQPLTGVLPDGARMIMGGATSALPPPDPGAANGPPVDTLSGPKTGQYVQSRTLINPAPRPAIAPRGPATLPIGVISQPVPMAKRDDDSDPSLGPDLDALERELALVNRDRPSVLGASITDELPRWSLPAPKLALLTDWTASDATPPTGNLTVDPVLTKDRADRRLGQAGRLQ
jgi:hypothetical protein